MFYYDLPCCFTVGLPAKGSTDADENRDKETGKSEFSPDNRRPVARHLSLVNAGEMRRIGRQPHGLCLIALVRLGLQIAFCLATESHSLCAIDACELDIRNSHRLLFTVIDGRGHLEVQRRSVTFNIRHAPTVNRGVDLAASSTSRGSR